MWEGTPLQKQTLKTFVLADPTLAGHHAAGRHQAIADSLNAPASPALWVFRRSVTKQEIYSIRSGDGTLWDWTVFAACSLQQMKVWDELFSSGSIDPSKENIPGAFAVVFTGSTAKDTAHKAHCRNVMRRQASIAEKLLASTASGDGSKPTPASLSWEGILSASDVCEIMA